MWPFGKRKRVDALIAKCDEALSLRRYEDVLPWADELLELRHTAGFELKARALQSLGRETEAIEVLRQGVALAPGVTPLWSWLGDLLSGARDYAGAHEAFARAATCPGANRAECIANDAWVFFREGRIEVGLARLNEAGDPKDATLRAFIARCRVTMLVALERHEDAIAAGSRAIDAIRAAEPATDHAARTLERELGHILHDLAAATWRGRKDKAAALELCLSAAHRNGGEATFALLREIEGLDASSAKLWQLVCRGRVVVSIDGDEPRPRNYFKHSLVLADSAEEALSFARRIEAAEWGDRLVELGIEKADALTTTVSGCKGVYRAPSGRTFYSESDSVE
jgi:tetratricopeptide (TPR) repeat protein